MDTMKKPKKTVGIIGRLLFAALIGIAFFFFIYPFNHPLSYITLVIAFLLGFYTTKWKKLEDMQVENELGIISYVTELQHTKSEEEIGKEIIRVGTYVRKVDFVEDILAPRKENKNITVTGMAGSGKTQLIYYLIEKMPYKKIILQYKNSDRYRELGYPVLFLKDYVPNVFLNVEALVQAWISSFVVENRGITASQLEPLVRFIAGKSHNWDDFKKIAESEAKKSEGTITGNALQDILLKLQSVYTKNMHKYEIPDELVIDFEGLNQNAFHFYAEWILRMLYEEIRNGKRSNTMIFIDEAKVFAESYNSIIPELAAIIRSRGAFLIATQRLSTIEGDVKANAGIQFTFKQTEPEDLKVASSLSEVYWWAVQRLQPYEFVDLAQSDSEFQVYIFKLINPNPIFKPIRIWQPQEDQKEDQGNTDYENVIYDLLSQAGNVQDIAKRIAQRYGGKVEEWRMKIKDIPKQMVKLGEINIELVDYVKFSGQQVFTGNSAIFFRKNENPSGLHTYMVNMTADVLHHKGFKFTIMPAGSGTADIESESEAFEIETGLKNDIEDVGERINAYKKNGKITIIIVPNQEVKKRYSEKYPEVRILTITELWGERL